MSQENYKQETTEIAKPKQDTVLALIDNLHLRALIPLSDYRWIHKSKNNLYIRQVSSLCKICLSIFPVTNVIETPEPKFIRNHDDFEKYIRELFKLIYTYPEETQREYLLAYLNLSIKSKQEVLATPLIQTHAKLLNNASRLELLSHMLLLIQAATCKQHAYASPEQQAFVFYKFHPYDVMKIPDFVLLFKSLIHNIDLHNLFKSYFPNASNLFIY